MMKQIRKTMYAVLWLMGCHVAIGQTGQDGQAGQAGQALGGKPTYRSEELPRALRKSFREAAQHTQARDFESAIAKYKHIIQKAPHHVPAHDALLGLYAQMGETTMRIPHLEALVRLEPSKRAPMAWELALMYFNQGQYGMAEARLHVHSLHCHACQDEQLLRSSLEFAKYALTNPLECTPKALSLPLNGFSTQYFASFTLKEDTVLFTARKQMEDEDLYISVQKQGFWQSPKPLPPPIGSEDNEGAGVISSNGKQLVFTACNRPDGLGSCDLYISERTKDGWSVPRNLGPGINTPHWESQPALSLDGRQLYFSSNRPGGLGMRDLWTIALPLEEEQYKTDAMVMPTNLGAQINTSGDELTPFVHANGSTLYFSSTGWPNLGGADIFVSEQDSTHSWGIPQNLGYPINDHHDQFGFTLHPEGKKAYYVQEVHKQGSWHSSWRQGKIYSVILPDEKQPQQTSTLMSGTVYDAHTKAPLRSLVSLSVLGNAQALYRVRSDSSTGAYALAVPTQASYLLSAQSTGYIPKTLSIAPAKAPDSYDFDLIPIQVGFEQVLPHILFATNEYTLDSISVTELNKMVFFLQLNPTLQIEIAGHTDNTGTAQHNQTLSMRRAQAVYDFLIKDGINEKRMRYQGYGAQKPLLPNNSEENKAKNRRISFEVTAL